MNDHIKEYWESQAKAHGPSHWASWGDNWMIDLEIESISRYVHDSDRVLDIGCANGFSTMRQHSAHALKSITGVDFSGEMIAAALKAKAGMKLGEGIEFREADIRKLPFPEGSFDLAYTTRVIINLPTWEEQKTAVSECLRVVKPGGRVVLSEGFWEPLMRLNAMRALAGLPALVEHDFNRYLKLARLKELLESQGLSYEVVDFSSLYYLGSRFVRELVTDPAAYPGYSNPINKIFFELEKDYSGGGFGIQQIVAITKK